MVFVDGWLVHEVRGTAQARDHDVRVPLFPYRGRVGSIRIVSFTEGRPLAVDDVFSLDYRNVRLLDELEGPGWSDLWETTFGPHPASNAPLARALGFPVAQGRQLASTLNRAGLLQLTSHPIRIDRERLGFAFLDHSGSAMRVELLVDGDVVRSRHGRGSRAMQWVDWDVRPWQGRDAVFRARDGNESKDRGFAIDSIILYDGPAQRPDAGSSNPP
jgi:hypothetical protein